MSVFLCEPLSNCFVNSFFFDTSVALPPLLILIPLMSWAKEVRTLVSEITGGLAHWYQKGIERNIRDWKLPRADLLPIQIKPGVMTDKWEKLWWL